MKRSTWLKKEEEIKSFLDEHINLDEANGNKKGNGPRSDQLIINAESISAS